jgi:phenylpropionate dioxygenase-like ring-hydroxylating dioxygenase large terminal subunit
MRRYWQPIVMSDELEDLPLLVCVLGETLVLVRDGGGRLGLFIDIARTAMHRWSLASSLNAA